ncbi:sensor histidine kinase [Haploplasma axanthum]|nr:GHKL domain-containing protein [Haploplasma axanthum]
MSSMGFIIGFIITLVYFKLNFKTGKRHWFEYIIASLIIATYVLISVYIDLGDYALPFSLVIQILVFYFGIRMRLLDALFLGTLYIFNYYSSRGIVLSAYSLIVNKNIQEISSSSALIVISHITSLLSLLLLIALVLILKKERLKLLFSVPKQVFFLTCYTLIEIAFIYMVNQGRYILDNNLWYSLTYFFTSLLSIIVFSYILRNILNLIKLIENEVYTVKLEEQLDMQLTHYEKYQSYITEMAKFKHDYYSVIKSIQTYVLNAKNDEALTFIKEILAEEQEINIPILEKTSNSFIVDAIIFDYSNKCILNNINFSSNLKFPNTIKFTQLELMKVFTNILSNALEASIQSPIDKRFIKIKSSAVNNWLVVSISNNYYNEIIIDNNDYVTTKSDRVLHGLGLKIVNEIITKKGGFTQASVNKERKIFTIQLSIPKTIE